MAEEERLQLRRHLHRPIVSLRLRGSAARQSDDVSPACFRPERLATRWLVGHGKPITEFTINP
jgi:hypothetical protein